MKLISIITLLLVSISVIAQNKPKCREGSSFDAGRGVCVSNCLLYDDYGIDTKNIKEVLISKGFEVTRKYPGGKYFSLSASTNWNLGPFSDLAASIYCINFSSSNVDSVESSVALFYDGGNRVATKKGNTFYNCPDTDDLTFQLKKKKSKLSAAKKLKTCKYYLKKIKSLD